MPVQRSEAREEPYTSYYVWADPGEAGGAPSNWLSKVGGKGWGGGDVGPGEELCLDMVREERAVLLPPVPGEAGHHLVPASWHHLTTLDTPCHHLPPPATA